MRKSRLEIVFNIKTSNFESDSKFGDLKIISKIDDIEIFNVICGVIENMGANPEFKLRGGKTLSGEEMRRSIEGIGGWPVEVGMEDLLLRVAHLPRFHQSYVIIEEEIENSIENWDEWVNPFLKHPEFVQAFVLDKEYSYWQNASDVLEYEAAGKDYTGLPMKIEWAALPSRTENYRHIGEPGAMVFGGRLHRGGGSHNVAWQELLDSYGKR